MRFARARMHPPRRLVISINRLRRGNRGAFVVVGGGARKPQRPSDFSAAIPRSECAEFGEVKIAIVPTPRPPLGQAVIGQHFQPHRSQLSRPPTRGDNIGVAIGPLAADEPRTIGLTGELRAAGRNDADNFKRRPPFFPLGQRFLPCRHFARDCR